MKGLSASKLYINCNKNLWYQTGIPGYSEDIGDTIDLLNRIISEITQKKLLLVEFPWKFVLHYYLNCT
jgi:hypothetical protein